MSAPSLAPQRPPYLVKIDQALIGRQNITLVQSGASTGTFLIQFVNGTAITVGAESLDELLGKLG